MSTPHPPSGGTAADPVPEQPTAPRLRVLIVTDGSEDSAHASSVTADLFPGADVEIMAAIPVTRDVYEGTTGFAGPVVGDDELTEIERARTVAAMGATAATARALGPRPVRRTEQRGEPVDVVLDRVGRSGPDVVVIASTGRGAPDAAGILTGDLVDQVGRPVVVVPPRPGDEPTPKEPTPEERGR